MDLNSLSFGVEYTKLRKIEHPKGDVFHALKASESSFNSFGEAYFTTIACGETKGWKLHKEMIMNLVVVMGEVKFHFRKDEFSTIFSFNLGSHNYGRLTIPPGVWVAFSGAGEDINLILNIASIEHDPAEAINAPLDAFSLG